MAYGYEFPHATMFDSDLREIIELLKKVMEKCNISQTLQSPYINVKECGAIGDGVVDDTKAFQIALSKSH